MSVFEIPSKMKAVLLQSYNTNIVRAMVGLKVMTIDMPVIGAQQVQIKIDAAPCNPSDIAFIRGLYGVKKNLPAVPGFEGCGLVVAAGKHEEAQKLIGKKVSCIASDDGYGSWAEYMITDFKNCIEVIENIPNEQSACMFINPLTAFALVETAKQKNTNAIILNAAASQTGQMIRVFAQKNSIKTINIVRSEMQVQQLQNRGEQYILYSLDEQFEQKLNETALALNAVVAIDAVSGAMTGKLLHAMPVGGTVIIYGGLSGNPASDISVLDIIYQKKTIIGFNLMDWIQEKDAASFKRITDQLQTMIISNELITEVQGKYHFTELNSGLKQYLGNMSAGKVLFLP